MPLLPRRRAPRADLPATPTETEPPQLRTPRSAAWWIIPITLLVGGVVGGLTWLLLTAGWSAAEAPVRQDAIRTALAAGAAVGAAVTLMLAFRRQRHQEHNAHVTAHLAARNAAVAEEVADNNKHDATERRVTDLYTKAVEQLGHDKAAVRLGGLYALQRLAQDNPGHRQTIINVICAYLRMPYTIPIPANPDLVGPTKDRTTALRAIRSRRVARAGKTPPVTAPLTPTDESGADREGELQVRLTAQSILVYHLRDDRPVDQRTTTPAADRFWEGMRIDLSGATLINLDFTNCQTAEANFSNATFSGYAKFDGATFFGKSQFEGAVFSRNAQFEGATFYENAQFEGATFSGYAQFDRAKFFGKAEFNWMIFSVYAMFNEAAFSRNAEFHRAKFFGYAQFNRAKFSGHAMFEGAAFSGDAEFERAVFSGDVDFKRAAFSGYAMFEGVDFSRDVRFYDAVFSGHGTFKEATFARRPSFFGATASSPSPYIHRGDYVWPDGWSLEYISLTKSRLICG